MANGLFDVGPLFDEPQPAEPEIKGLFGFDPESAQFTQDTQEEISGPEEQAAVDKEIERVNEVAAERIERIRNSGLLSRYPVIENEEDEARERARLARRGLKPEEVDRRIEKFKKKGGKVKTSSKLLAAATLLAGGINGYLAAKRGRPIPMGGGLTQLRAEAAARMDAEIERIEEEAKERKALLLREDEQEYKMALEEIKADLREQAKLDDESRRLGVDTRGMNLEQKFDAVTAENQRRAKVKEEMEERKERRREESQEATQARARVTLASQLNDPSLASDRDIAIFYELDPKNAKEKINEIRSRMDARARLRSIQAQQAITKKDIDIAAAQEKLDEPPKETPEERDKRRADEKRQEELDEALAAYKASVGPATVSLQRWKGNEAKEKMILSALVSQLRLAQPDWSEQQLTEEVIRNVGDAISVQQGLTMEQIEAFREANGE